LVLIKHVSQVNEGVCEWTNFPVAYNAELLNLVGRSRAFNLVIGGLSSRASLFQILSTLGYILNVGQKFDLNLKTIN